MNYTETIQYLYESLPVFHRTGKAAYKADLNNSLKLDEYFNRPHERYKTVHVAGTNGKGSVSHIVAAMLQAAGYKTGLYTSPHLLDFRERIKIDGKEIPQREVIDFVETNRDFINDLRPSFFEMASAMAFDAFARAGVDVAVVETGMGGRLDSTNIIAPELSVITNIGFDHTEFLGDTLAKIAIEKAGIIKRRTPAVIGERHEESAPVFEAATKKLDSQVYFAEDILRIISVEEKAGLRIFRFKPLDDKLFGSSEFSVSLDLLGDYQRKNIVTALVAAAVLRTKGLDLNPDRTAKACATAARSTGLQGRWQIVGSNPTLVFDTGHNAHGLSEVAEQLKRLRYEKLFVIFGLVNDKNVDAILPLLPRDAHYFFTQANIPRAMDASVLAEKCRAAGLFGEIKTRVADALEAALDAASQNDVIFTGGSTFVVADALSQSGFRELQDETFNRR